MSEQAIPTEPPKHPGGRPPIYSPEVVGKLRGVLQLGLSVETACEHACIDASTFYDWQKKYPEFLERMTAARTYGKLLAAQQVHDVLQDIARDQGQVIDPKTQEKVKPKYSETTRATTSRWYLEKHEKQIYGSQSMLAAKLESDGKGGQSASIIYANDDILRQFARQEEVSAGQLLEALEDSIPGEEITRGGTEEPAPPVHTEELQSQHSTDSSLSQP